MVDQLMLINTRWKKKRKPKQALFFRIYYLIYWWFWGLHIFPNPINFFSLRTCKDKIIIRYQWNASAINNSQMHQQKHKNTKAIVFWSSLNPQGTGMYANYNNKTKKINNKKLFFAWKKASFKLVLHLTH